MANFLERLRRLPRRRWLYIGAAVFVGGTSLLSMARDGGKADVNDLAEQSLVVKRVPFIVLANFSGRIAPGDRVDLTAPFEAAVLRLGFSYGDHVEAGQVLVQLDPADVSLIRAEAESVWLKAKEEAVRMESWEQGPEVRRASRAVTTAADELNDLEVKLSETKALLDRGLVPRSEYDGMMQQRRQRQSGLIVAQEEYDDTVRRGQGGELRIALLQRDIARSRYASIGGTDGTIIRAPEAGVIVRPDSEGEHVNKGIFAGGRVSKGEQLGVIASTRGLDVIFTLDETDLNSVILGQKAVVTGPGFGGATLNGHVTGISGQADAVAGGGKATFTARIRLDPLSWEASRNIRIGMTASIAVVAYENASALVVPPEAIQGATPRAWVMVRPRGGRTAEPRTVSIGRAGPFAVEVLSGLRTGETVVWQRTVKERQNEV